VEDLAAYVTVRPRTECPTGPGPEGNVLRRARVRVSHAVAVVLLFLGGCALGRYAELGPIRTGLATMSIGVVLFALTIALGG
jgi:hypothetical protein